MKFKELKISYYKGKPPKIREGGSLLPYLTPDYIRIGAIPEFFPVQAGVVIVENNELILLWDGSNAGEFFKGKKGILSSTMVKFDKIEGTDDDYIFYSLKLQEPILKSKTSGSGIPHVDKDALFNLEIFLPAKEQQTTIASILTTIDQAIEKTEQLIAKYERIKTGLMQDLLTHGIDEQGNIRSEKTHEFKDSVLGRIPLEWDVKPISEITENESPICYGIVQVRQHDYRGVPTLAIKDIGGDFKTGVHLTSKDIESQYKRSRIIQGDILISIKATIGKIAIVPSGFKGNISRDLARIRLTDNCVPNYYKYYFLSQKGMNSLLDISVGTTRKEVSIVPLRKLLATIPSKEEQNRISNILQQYDNVLLRLVNENKNMNSLKTGLMQDLLTGKVCVDALLKK